MRTKMRKLLVVLVGVALVLPWVTYVDAKDYMYLDKNNQYRGYVSDDGRTITRYDKHNRTEGWIDRSTGATFDGRNNFKGFIITPDRDDD